MQIWIFPKKGLSIRLVRFYCLQANTIFDILLYENVKTVSFTLYQVKSWFVIVLWDAADWFVILM